MKKCLAVAFALLLLSSLAGAQFTTVTGTVVDPNGAPYANGTITAALVLSGVTPTINGGSFTMTGSAGLSGVATATVPAGSFTMRLADNAVMVPGTLKWSFTVCSAAGTILPAAGTGPVCFTPAAITITGASQSISAQLQAAAPALSTVAAPSVVLARSSFQNRSATVAATTIFTPAATALYQINWYGTTITPCTTGAGAITPVYTWTDENGTAKTTSGVFIISFGMQDKTIAGTTLVAVIPTGSLVLQAAVGVPVQLTLTYTACTTGTGVFSYYVSVIAL